jgi:hypothetical protein
MNRHEIEQQFCAHVAGWVEGQNGRWRENASDAFLTALLVRLSGLPPEDAEEKPNFGYDVACLVFETCMERGCGVGANGHHVAQSFNLHVRAFRPVEQPGNKA